MKNGCGLNLTATCCRRVWGSGSRDLGESDSVRALGTVVGEPNLRKLLRKDGTTVEIWWWWYGHLEKRRVVGVRERQ